MGKQQSETFKRKFYNFFLNHWIFTGIAVSLPTIGIVILKFFGADYNAWSSNSIGMKIAIVLLLILQLFALVFTAVKFSFDKREVQANPSNFYRSQMQVIMGIVKETTASLSKVINKDTNSYIDIARIVPNATIPFEDYNSSTMCQLILYKNSTM